jgi:hypothetical protein
MIAYAGPQPRLYQIRLLWLSLMTACLTSLNACSNNVSKQFQQAIRDCAISSQDGLPTTADRGFVRFLDHDGQILPASEQFEVYFVDWQGQEQTLLTASEGDCYAIDRAMKGSIFAVSHPTQTFRQISTDTLEYANHLQTFTLDSPVRPRAKLVCPQPAYSPGSLTLPLERATMVPGYQVQIGWQHTVNKELQKTKTYLSPTKLPSALNFAFPQSGQYTITSETRRLGRSGTIAGDHCQVTVFKEQPPLDVDMPRIAFVTDDLILRTNESLRVNIPEYADLWVCRQPAQLSDHCLGEFVKVQSVAFSQAGKWDVFIKARDPVGNESDVWHQQLTIDPTPPQLSLKWAPDELNRALGIAVEAFGRLTVNITSEDDYTSADTLRTHQQCRVHLEDDRFNTISTIEARCRSTSCQGLSLRRWRPCGEQLTFDLTELTQYTAQSPIDPKHLNVVLQVKTRDQADHQTTETSIIRLLNSALPGWTHAMPADQIWDRSQEQQFRRIQEGPDGTVWTVSADRLLTISPEMTLTPVPLLASDSEQSLQIETFFIRDKTLWLLTRDHQIYRLPASRESDSPQLVASLQPHISAATTDSASTVFATDFWVTRDHTILVGFVEGHIIKLTADEQPPAPAEDVSWQVDANEFAIGGFHGFYEAPGGTLMAMGRSDYRELQNNAWIAHAYPEVVASALMGRERPYLSGRATPRLWLFLPGLISWFEDGRWHTQNPEDLGLPTDFYGRSTFRDGRQKRWFLDHHYLRRPQPGPTSYPVYHIGHMNPDLTTARQSPAQFEFLNGIWSRQGDLWLLTNAGIISQQEATPALLQPFDKLATSLQTDNTTTFHGFSRSPQGHLWLGYRHTLINTETGQTLSPLDPQFPFDEIFGFQHMGASGLWLAGARDGHLAYGTYKDSEWTKIYEFSEIDSSSIHSAGMTANGTIWIDRLYEPILYTSDHKLWQEASRHGEWRVTSDDAVIWQANSGWFEEPRLLRTDLTTGATANIPIPLDEVTHLLTTADSDVWVLGYDASGSTRLLRHQPGDNWETQDLSAAATLAGSFVDAGVDSYGRLYLVGTDQFSIYKQNQWHTKPLANTDVGITMLSNTKQTLIEDEMVWLNTHAGLFVHDPHRNRDPFRTEPDHQRQP